MKHSKYFSSKEKYAVLGSKTCIIAFAANNLGRYVWNLKMSMTLQVSVWLVYISIYLAS